MLMQDEMRLRAAVTSGFLEGVIPGKLVTSPYPLGKTTKQQSSMSLEYAQMLQKF